MTREERALQLIGTLSEAAVEPSLFQQFAKDVSEAFRGAAVRFALNLPGDAAGPQQYMVGLEPEYSGSFLESLMGGLPWTTETVSEYAVGWSCLGDLFPGVDLRRTEFYREWMRPQKLSAVWPMSMPIMGRDGLPLGGITLFRPGGGHAFSADDAALGDLIAPHLARAVRVRLRLAGVQRERLALAEVMDRLPTGVILLDRRRQPVVTNKSADRILALEDGIGIGASGPFADNARDNKALRKLLDSALDPEPGREIEAGGFVPVARPSGRRSFVVMITPLLEASPESAADDAVVSLHIADPEAGQVSTTEVLETVYQLTPAEAELVRLLAEGRSVEEAAAMRGVTMNTARSQLKQVFAKTDTRRQGELVRLVLTGVASIRDG